MTVRIGHLVIPIARDFQVCGDCFFLNCKGKRIVDLILIRVSILAVLLHFFEVFDNLIQVALSDLF